MKDPADLFTEQFFHRYLAENDYRLAGPGIPLDPQVFAIARDLAVGAAGGALEKLGEAAYRQIKKKLQNVLTNRKRSPLTVVHLRGLSPELTAATILEFGKVRPLFHVQKGFLGVLSDVTIAFVGQPVGLVKEDEAPGFVFNGVTLTQVSERRKKAGHYQIYTPIWIGRPGENPYDKRDRGGGVLTFE